MSRSTQSTSADRSLAVVRSAHRPRRVVLFLFLLQEQRAAAAEPVGPPERFNHEDQQDGPSSRVVIRR
jgi:hypothetical protein